MDCSKMFQDILKDLFVTNKVLIGKETIKKKKGNNKTKSL